MTDALAPSIARPTRRLLCLRTARALLLGASVAMLAACGSGNSGAGASTATDPASVVPASATLFAGASVRPSGALQTAALAAGKGLTHQADPYLRLLTALQTPGSPQLSFKDVESWLGPEAGVYLSSLQSAGPLLALIEQSLLGGTAGASAFPFSTTGAQGAIVLDTTDAGKAQAFLDTQAAHAGAHPTSYRGTSYKVSAAGVAFAIVKQLAVIGSESGVHAVIDTSLGGESLAHSSNYGKLLAAAPAGTLGHLYTSPQAKPAESPGSTPTSGLLGLLAGARPANISLIPAAGSLALDADTIGAAQGLLASDPEGSSALTELPGESWLAIGLGNLGPNLAADVAGIEAIGSLGSRPGVTNPGGGAGSVLTLQSLLGAMTAPLKVMGADTPQAKRTFGRWIGSAGVFASGGSLLELKAAIVIDSSDAAASSAAVAKLAARLRAGGGTIRHVSIPGTHAAVGVALRGLPVVLDIASGPDSAGHEKFVLGFGEASVESALNPQGTLANEASSTAAATALGESIKPSLILDVPTLVSLLEGVGLTEDPSISGFVPYLRAAGTVSGGGRELGGGIDRFRIVLGLQHTPAG